MGLREGAPNLAGEDAYACREWVARKFVEIIGGHERELVHTHHTSAPPYPHPPNRSPTSWFPHPCLAPPPPPRIALPYRHPQ